MLTTTQIELKKQLLNLYGFNPFKYEDAKKQTSFKSFDTSLNALLHRGHLERVKTNDYSNQFKIIIK